jgi:hypothetical protein
MNFLKFYIKFSYQNTQPSFSGSYILSDGHTRNKKGALNKVGDKNIITVKGSYSFKGTDSKTCMLNTQLEKMEIELYV